MTGADAPLDRPAPIVIDDRIRRDAQLYFGAFVVGVVLLITDAAFRLPLLSHAAALVIPLGEIPLVVALRDVVTRGGPSAPSATMWTGLAGIALAIGVALGRIAGLPAELADPIATVSTALDGIWLLAIGLLSPTLPTPLPRRAVLGGIGWILAGISIVVDPNLTMFPLILAASILSIFALAFILGLTRPPRAEDAARP